MNREIFEQIKELMKANLEFKFGNPEINNNRLILDVRVIFQKEKFELVFIGRDYANEYLAIFNEDTRLMLSGFDEIENYFSTIISRIEGTDKIQEQLKDKPSVDFISDTVAELLKEIFKQSRTYKMHCLYDERVEKILK